MFTIRCTRKLLKHLHADSREPGLKPSTVLGDWYANLLYTRHLRLVMAVSERSLLPVFVEARDRATFVPRFRVAARAVMKSIGVAAHKIEQELREMEQAAIGPTASRVILGSMNDLAFLSRAQIEEGMVSNLLELALKVADTPCGPIAMQRPDKMTLALMRDRFG